MKYAGMGLYIGPWEEHTGPEGNLRRSAQDLVYGDKEQFADAERPELFVGTYANYVEIDMGGLSEGTA